MLGINKKTLIAVAGAWVLGYKFGNNREKIQKTQEQLDTAMTSLRLFVDLMEWILVHGLDLDKEEMAQEIGDRLAFMNLVYDVK